MTSRKTALYQNHIQLKARMVDFAGWQMPIQYAPGIIKEHEAVRDHVGIFDVSHMGEIEISGSSALAFCQWIACNDASFLKPGKIQYSAILNENGGVIDDCTLYQLAEDHYLFVVNASRKAQVLNWFLKNKMEKVTITDKSDYFGLLALQGKQSQALLSEVLGRELDSIKYYEFAIAQYQGHALIVSRTGYSGEDGFEIYIPESIVVSLWEELLNKGQTFKIQPIGLGARDTLRLEMGYMLYGQDMDEATTALEAGLSWIVKMDKGNFCGKKALLAQKESGLEQKVFGLKMVDKGIPRAHYKIYKDETMLGEVTSGTFSPTLKKGIALARLSSKIKLGDDVWVEIRNEKHPAIIVKPPFATPSVKK